MNKREEHSWLSLFLIINYRFLIKNYKHQNKPKYFQEEKKKNI